MGMTMNIMQCRLQQINIMAQTSWNSERINLSHQQCKFDSIFIQTLYVCGQSHRASRWSRVPDFMYAHVTSSRFASCARLIELPLLSHFNAHLHLEHKFCVNLTNMISSFCKNCKTQLSLLCLARVYLFVAYLLMFILKDKGNISYEIHSTASTKSADCDQLNYFQNLQAPTILQLLICCSA